MNKKTIIILIASVLVLLIVIGVVFALLLANATKPKSEIPKLDKNIIMYELEESFVSNIKDSKKIFKGTIELKLSNKKIVKILDAKEAEIRNEVFLILRSKDEDDFTGSEGQVKLQNEILEGLKRITETDKILNVYFKEFIIQ